MKALVGFCMMSIIGISGCASEYKENEVRHGNVDVMKTVKSESYVPVGIATVMKTLEDNLSFNNESPETQKISRLTKGKGYELSISFGEKPYSSYKIVLTESKYNSGTYIQQTIISSQEKHLTPEFTNSLFNHTYSLAAGMNK
jgi:hypothetical protein